MDACIGHDRAGRNRIRILLHDPLDQHAGCHRIYRPGAARPAAGILITASPQLAIAVAQSFPSLPSTCNQARGLRQTRLHLGRVLINAQIAAYFYAGAYVVQKTHVAILVDRAYKPHFCADGEVRWLDLAFTRRRSSPNSGRTP